MLVAGLASVYTCVLCLAAFAADLSAQTHSRVVIKAKLMYALNDGQQIHPLYFQSQVDWAPFGAPQGVARAGVDNPHTHDQGRGVHGSKRALSWCKEGLKKRKGQMTKAT